MLAGCDWWISIQYVDNIWLTEILETFPRVFCFRKSRINENGGNEVEGREGTHDMFFLLIQVLLKPVFPQHCQKTSKSSDMGVEGIHKPSIKAWVKQGRVSVYFSCHHHLNVLVHYCDNIR